MCLLTFHMFGHDHLLPGPSLPPSLPPGIILSNSISPFQSWEYVIQWFPIDEVINEYLS